MSKRKQLAIESFIGPNKKREFIEEKAPPVIVNIKKAYSQYDIYIGREFDFHGQHIEGSKWANPFPITRDRTRKEAIELYRNYILSDPKLMDSLPELTGKKLGCWCFPKRCHADVLVELWKIHVLKK